MFLGHFAVALAAKRVTPRVSLGTLIFSAQFLDLLWPLFLLAGVEHVRIDPGNTPVTPLDFYDYPLSHSLLTTIGWAVIVGGTYYLAMRNPKTSFVLYALVMSHWILDFLSHRPDLPLVPGFDLWVGLGLWGSVFWTVVVEILLLFGGVAIYLKTTVAQGTGGRVAFWVFIVFLLSVYLASLFSSPPPGERELAIISLSLWLLVPIGYWLDRGRVLREPS